MNFNELVITNIKKNIEITGKKKSVILPESEDIRTLKAINILQHKDWINRIYTLGNKDNILKKFSSENFEFNNKVEFIDITEFDKTESFVNEFYEMRKHKGIDKNQSAEVMKQPLYFSAMFLKKGLADGMVAGAVNSTGNVLKPAIQIIKTKPGINIISSFFVMEVPNCEYGEKGSFIFADCAVNPEPDKNQLAEIAVSTAESTQKICGFEPKIAMLSFSTKGSASHKLVDKVCEAVKIVKGNHPEIKIDGELQADAAILKSVGSKKAPDSDIAGNANVLVFPDLQSGNISYKLVQRLAGADATGPVIQGLNKPVNDLSRGCSVEDIVNVTAVTLLQSY